MTFWQCNPSLQDCKTINKLKNSTPFAYPVSEVGLESVRVSTDSTAKCKFLSGGRMDHPKWTLLALEWNTLWPYRTLGVLLHQHQPLKVLMTGATKVCGSETKINRHRTTISTFVLQIIGAMFGTNLCLCHIRTSPTDQLLWVKIFIIIVGFTTCFTTIVGFSTFETQIIGIPTTKKTVQVGFKNLKLTCR